jgi:hypothetical protein
MFTIRVPALSFAACLLATATAAQTAAPSPTPAGEPRLTFSLNGLAQPADQDLTSSGSFDLYEEIGQFDVFRSLSPGFAFDIGVTYQLGRHLGFDRLGVGLGITTASDTHGASVTGTAPHPLFFNRPRAFATEVGGLKKTERAVHLQATWLVPITTAWDVTLFGGPSFLNGSLDQLEQVSIAELGSPFTTVEVGPAVITKRRGTGVGINIGADSMYVLLRDVSLIKSLGAGLTLRYAGGSVDVQAPGGGSQSIDVGGFHIGLGLRARF